jgi:membrane protease YdiL (CAAX protease family)
MADPELPPEETMPAGPACETAPATASVPRHCVLCGRAGCGWTAAAAGLGAAGHRCAACYSPLPTGALFCTECGREAKRPEAAAWRTAHTEAGRFCAAARLDQPHRQPTATIHQGEDLPGFENIREVGLFFGVILALVLVNFAWGFHTHDDSTASEFVFSGLFYGTIAGFAWRWRDTVRPLLRWPDYDRLGLLAMVSTPVLTLTAIEGQSLLARWLHIPVYSYIKNYVRDGYGFGTALVMVAVLPALFEEIAFRGLILSKLRHVMSLTQALLVTAVLFAVIHFNIVGLFIFLVPMAFLAGWVTARTRSLFPAMLIHFLHNSGVVLLEHYGL